MQIKNVLIIIVRQVKGKQIWVRLGSVYKCLVLWSSNLDYVCKINYRENQNETISLDDNDDSVNGSEERILNSSLKSRVNSYLIIMFVILFIGGWKKSLACL